MSALFAYPPNWRGGVLERLTWLTGVRTAHDGSEARSRLRLAPRRSLQWEVLATTLEAQQLDSLLWAEQSREILVPIWTDATQLTAPASAGTDALVLSTEGRDFSESRLAVLWAGPGVFEIFEIRDMEADAILTLDALSRSWPAGTVVYPVRWGRLQQVVPLERVTAGVVGATVFVDLVDDPQQAATTGKNYGGRQIFDRTPNRSGAVSTQFARRTTTLDWQTGPVAVDDHAGRPFVGRQHSYLFSGRDEVWWLRRWLHGLGGRYTRIFVPNWQADLTVVEDVEGTTLRVRRIDWSRYGTTQPGRAGRDVLQIRLHDGTTYERAVAASTLISDTVEQLTLAAPALPVISRDQVAQVTWLESVRLGSDAVELAWLTAETVQIQLPFEQVRQ